MKTLLVLLSVLVSTTLSAAVAADVKFEGTYKAVRPFGSFGYPNAKACKADGGKFSEGGLCVFKDGGATVEIKKITDGNFNVAISSVGTNFHTCDYSGEAKVVNQVQLISNDLDSEESTGCEVTVSFTSQNTLAITTNNKCQAYCGANMALDEEKVTRTK